MDNAWRVRLLRVVITYYCSAYDFHIHIGALRRPARRPYILSPHRIPSDRRPDGGCISASPWQHSPSIDTMSVGNSRGPNNRHTIAACIGRPPESRQYNEMKYALDWCRRCPFNCLPTFHILKRLEANLKSRSQGGCPLSVVEEDQVSLQSMDPNIIPAECH